MWKEVGQLERVAEMHMLLSPTSLLCQLVVYVREQHLDTYQSAQLNNPLQLLLTMARSGRLHKLMDLALCCSRHKIATKCSKIQKFPCNLKQNISGSPTPAAGGATPLVHM